MKTFKPIIIHPDFAWSNSLSAYNHKHCNAIYSKYELEYSYTNEVIVPYFMTKIVYNVFGKYYHAPAARFLDFTT